MAVFATGNPMWDQGGNAFAGGIMSALDPSNAAKAGMYGAEQAKAEAESQRLRKENIARWGLPTNPLGGMTPPAYVEPVSPLAGTVAGAQRAPVAAAPPPPPAQAGQSLPQTVVGQPSLGTNGQPMPPDPSLATGGVLHPGSIQQEGGGVKNAPPAQANGSPAPPMDLTMYATQLAQTGWPVEVQRQLLGNALNTAVSRGVIDKVTANTMLGRFGASAMYGEDQSTYRQGTVNTTTLANTRLQGENTIRNTKETGTQTRESYDNELVDVKVNGQMTKMRRRDAVNMPGYDSAAATQAAEPYVVKGPNGPMVSTKGAAPGQPAYDSPAVIAASKPMTVNGPNGPVIATEGTAPGSAPASEGDMVYAVPVKGGAAPIQMTRAQLRMRPDMMEATQSDLAHTIVTGKGAPSPYVTRGAQTVDNTSVSPVPQTTDAANARTMAGGIQAAAAGDQPLADTIFGAWQQGQFAGIPKQVINPDQDARMRQISDAHLKSLYPIPSGSFQWDTTHYTPTADPDTLAYHDALTRYLQRGEMRNDPGAAVTRAWDMMRETGVIPRDSKEAREGTARLGIGNTAKISGGDDPRLLIMLRKDAKGNIINSQGQVMPWPGGGPRPSPLVNTVAPAVAPPSPTPPATGAGPKGRPIGAAPPGPDGKPVPDGTPITGPNGERGVVHAGQVYAP
jgi:hypothetical protein